MDLEKIKNFMRKHGFIIAAAAFFLASFSDTDNSTYRVLALVFFVLSFYEKN